MPRGRKRPPSPSRREGLEVARRLRAELATLKMQLSARDWEINNEKEKRANQEEAFRAQIAALEAEVLKVKSTLYDLMMEGEIECC